MKIVNVTKFIRSILIVLVIIGCLSLFLSNQSLSYKEREYQTISVYSGDTLWSIAKDLQSTNNYYKGKDVRDIIEDIVKINELDSKTVYANQKLQIPMI